MVHLESEENETGALTSPSEEYRETFEKGGIDTLVDMLAKEREKE